MTRSMIPIAALAVLALGGCKQSEAQSAAPPSKAPAVKVVGEAVSCIPIIQIRNSRVYDDRTIDFEMTGNRLYRNTLPSACPRLGFEEAFSYKTSLSQLCSTDIIHVLDRTGGGLREGAGCGLGQFVPVEKVK